MRSITSLSASKNRIADLSPVAGFRAPFHLDFSGNRIRDLSPLEKWMAPDLAGPRSFAPFVRVHLEDNPLSRNSRKIVEGLKSKGARINPAGSN